MTTISQLWIDSACVRAVSENYLLTVFVASIGL